MCSVKFYTFLSFLIAVTPVLCAGSFITELGQNLVKFDPEKEIITDLDEGALQGKKIIALYYSAHWCPPCRRFTPQLVEQYQKLAKAHDIFELIFVSYDKNEKSMLEYMKWGKMTFPALRYGAQIPLVEELSSEGIPYLVVVDEQGTELAGRNGADYINPEVVLRELKRILEKSP